MTLFQRAALSILSLVVRLVERKIPMPSLVMLACPPVALPALKVWMRDNAAIPVDEFDLVLRVGADGSPYLSAPYQYGALQLSAAQIELLRPDVSDGGPLYLLGIRARRAFFPPSETTTGEPGKLAVTVIDAGEPIPPQTAETWETTRLTGDRFLEELGAPGPALVVLEPPEPAI